MNGSDLKVYKKNSSPEGVTPFITIDIDTTINRQGWKNHNAIFTIWGKTWAEIYPIATELRRVIQLPNFTNLGSIDISEGEDPVTELLTLSISASFGDVI